MQNTNFHACASPTFPVQDKFGALLIQFGFSKLEYTAVAMCAALTQKNGGQVEPEVLAEEAVAIAMALLERVHEETLKDTTSSGPTISLK